MTFSYLWNSSHTKNVSSELFGTHCTQKSVKLYQTIFDTSYRLCLALRNTISTKKKHNSSILFKNILFFHVVYFAFHGKNNKNKKTIQKKTTTTQVNTCSTQHLYSLFYTRLIYTFHITTKILQYYLNTIHQHCWLILHGRRGDETWLLLRGAAYNYVKRDRMSRWSGPKQAATCARRCVAFHFWSDE